jgi:hypothetical protein
MGLTRLPAGAISGAAATDIDVYSNFNVGSVDSGELIPTGTTLRGFVQQLLTAIFAPTYVAPTASLSSSISSPQESGFSASLTLTAALNKGAINGVFSNNTWNPSTKQADRSGAVTKYTIDGYDNGTTAAYVKGTVTIADGANTYSTTVDYAQGPTPLNSAGLAFAEDGTTPLTALSAGSVTASATVTGQRKYFFGFNNAGSTSAQIRSLGNGALNPSNGTTFAISIPTGTTSVVFAYPATLEDVNTVKYVQGLNAEVKGTFTKTTVNVEGANGYTAISYKVYRATFAEATASAQTYNVTI